MRLGSWEHRRLWRQEGIAMEHTRFDRLARSIGAAPSRRRLLGLAASATLAGASLRAGEIKAKKKKKGRKRCHIEAGKGVCVHQMCAIACKKATGCNNVGGQLPSCGPASFDCGCAKLLNGKTACVLPRHAADLCLRTPCQSNHDCLSGQACVAVPGCCSNGKTHVCAVSCQEP
ncbi:MAG TPA: hypothetical protein VFX03_01000 [Thermomicrobiales bacterium]|nr:hypothetical protein [Thermomicrobiales bacterium]